MPVTGRYMVRRMQHAVAPYVRAYGQLVVRDLLPTFSNLSERADEIANAEFNRLGSLPADEDESGDMSDEAETARETGQTFYDTMIALRQTTLNLYAAGLFHLIEQQLSDICGDRAFHGLRLGDTKMKAVAQWYKDHCCLDFTLMPAWPKIEELRLLANAVKHAEGDSATKLRKLRPDIFVDPRLAEFPDDFMSSSNNIPLGRPLAGEGIFVTEAIFCEFAEAADTFVGQIIENFVTHQDDHYPVDS